MRHEYYYRGFIIQIEDSLKSFVARVFKDVTESPLIRLQAESGASSTKLLLAQARSRVDTLLKKEQSFAGQSSIEPARSPAVQNAKDKAFGL
jgi:hypothetical protein